MKIYTSGCGGKKLKKIAERDMGILATPPNYVRPCWKGFDVALDNGAFSCWMRGVEFDSESFMKHLAKAKEHGIEADFIVCPDIVAGGLESLEFSRKWAYSDELIEYNNLYLAVQDGMDTSDVSADLLSRFAGIFIGGTVEWKWKNAQKWSDFAHKNGMKCHIGRVGRTEALHQSSIIGVDSVDSSNFARNDSFGSVDRFNNEITFGF